MRGLFERALAGFDEANAEDPNTEIVNGEEVCKELVYGRRMSMWLVRMWPDASEPLRLAVRCQHIQRWKSPRTDYPEGRVGYKKWRSDLARMHADIAGAILAEVGYDNELVERVKLLVQKRRLKTDSDAQRLEDIACLVFLHHYFADFVTKHDDDKLVDIVQKTWRKMSHEAHEAALKLSFGDREAAIIERALGDG